MQKKFIPTWIDRHGNRFFFVSKSLYFDESWEATNHWVKNMLGYSAFQWKVGENLEAEYYEDLGLKVPHVPGKAMNFPIGIISGPAFEECLKIGVEA